MVIDVAGNVVKQFFGQTVSAPVKHHQIDQHLVFQQKFAESGNGDLQGLVLGKTVIVGGDEGKGDGSAAMGQCQLQGFIITAAKQDFLSIAAAVPYRANGVDNVFGGKTESGGDGSVSHRNGADLLPGSQKLRTGFFVDAGIGTQSYHRPGIGGIDDGIHLHMGDVISHDLKGHVRTCLSF